MSKDTAISALTLNDTQRRLPAGDYLSKPPRTKSGTFWCDYRARKRDLLLIEKVSGWQAEKRYLRNGLVERALCSLQVYGDGLRTDAPRSSITGICR